VAWDTEGPGPDVKVILNSHERERGAGDHNLPSS